MEKRKNSNSPINRNDLKAFGNDLLHKISQLMDTKITEVEKTMHEEIEELGQKVTLTMKQVGSMAVTSGFQVEEILRERLRIRVERGDSPFQYFGTHFSRNPSTWNSLSDVCRYLHIDAHSELYTVLLATVGIMSTSDELKAFIQTILKDIKTSSEDFGMVCGLFHHGTAAQVGKVLRSILGHHRTESKKQKLSVVISFLELLGCVHLQDQQLKQRIQALVECGQISIKERFIFILLVWWSSKRIPSKKLVGKGVIRLELEIDAEGMCFREGSTFKVGMAQMKSSSTYIPNAKLQLVIGSQLLSSVVSFLHGSCMVEKFVLIFAKEDTKGRGQDDDDFHICYMLH